MLAFLVISLVTFILLFATWSRFDRSAGHDRPVDYQPGDGRPAGPDAEVMREDAPTPPPGSTDRRSVRSGQR